MLVAFRSTAPFLNSQEVVNGRFLEKDIRYMFPPCLFLHLLIILHSVAGSIIKKLKILFLTWFRSMKSNKEVNKKKRTSMLNHRYCEALIMTRHSFSHIFIVVAV